MKTTGTTLSNLISFSLVFFLFAFLLALTAYRNGNLSWPHSRRISRHVTAPAPPPVAVNPEHERLIEDISNLPNSANETALPSPAPAEQNAKSAPSTAIKYRAGEDPVFARQRGWPINGPAPLSGAILPQKRILAFYGNPLSGRMGILGQSSKEDMLHRLRQEVTNWQSADPAVQVQPALHLIAVTAQPTPGKAGKYRMIMPDKIVKQVYEWAKEANALLFIDLQPGHDDIRELLPRFEWILKNPDVHLGIDPEFNLVKSRAVPGTQIGTFDAAEINYVTGYLRELV